MKRRIVPLLLAAIVLLAPIAKAAAPAENADSIYQKNRDTLAYIDSLFETDLVPEKKDVFLGRLFFAQNAYPDGNTRDRDTMLLAYINLEKIQIDGVTRFRATVLENYGGSLPDQFFLLDKSDITGKKSAPALLIPGECVMQFRAYPEKEANLHTTELSWSFSGNAIYAAQKRLALDAGENLWLNGSWFGTLDELRAASIGQYPRVCDSSVGLDADAMRSARLKEDAVITDRYGGIVYGQGKKWDALVLSGEPYGDKGKERVLVLMKDCYGSVALSALNLPDNKKLQPFSPYARFREIEKLLSVRSKPGGSGDLIGYLRPGFLAAQVGPEKNGYVLVQAGGKQGYVPASGLTASNASPVTVTEGIPDIMIDGASDENPQFYDWFAGTYYFGRYYVMTIAANTPKERKAELKEMLEACGIQVREVKYSWNELDTEFKELTQQMISLEIQALTTDPYTNTVCAYVQQPTAKKIAKIKAAMKHPEALRVVEYFEPVPGMPSLP